MARWKGKEGKGKERLEESLCMSGSVEGEKNEGNKGGTKNIFRACTSFG